MCAAATTTIVQARQIVDVGNLNPEHIITPGLFVDHVIEISDPQQEELLIRTEAVYQ